MARRLLPHIARPLLPPRAARRYVGWACLTALLLPAWGCNSFGNSRLVKELQSENERLLAEFRAQRDRASELEKANRLQAERLAESEKLLARLSQGGGSSRLSSLPGAGGPPLGGPTVPNAGNLPGGMPTSAANDQPPATGELRWLPRYDN